MILWLGFFLDLCIENSNMQQPESPLQAPLKKFRVKLHPTYIIYQSIFDEMNSCCSIERSSLTHLRRCSNLVTPADALGHWKRQSHAKPGHRLVAKAGRFPRWTGTKPAVKTGHRGWCHWGKNSKTGPSQTNQPTTIFCEVWKPFKKGKAPSKNVSPFFLVEDRKGEFRLCRFASGI